MSHTSTLVFLVFAVGVDQLGTSKKALTRKFPGTMSPINIDDVDEHVEAVSVFLLQGHIKVEKTKLDSEFLQAATQAPVHETLRPPELMQDDKHLVPPTGGGDDEDFSSRMKRLLDTGDDSRSPMNDAHARQLVDDDDGNRQIKVVVQQYAPHAPLHGVKLPLGPMHEDTRSVLPAGIENYSPSRAKQLEEEDDISHSRQIKIANWTLTIILLLFLLLAGTLKAGHEQTNGRSDDMLKQAKSPLMKVSLEELQTHNHAGSLWISLDGMVVDVTAFAGQHPGGLEVLQHVAGAEAGNDFEEAGHSDLARQLAQKYAIGVLSCPPHHNHAVTKKQASVVGFTRLFTHEDPLNVHKTLGLLCLLHYIFRFGMEFSEGSSGFRTDLLSFLLILMHFALSASSVIFSVPQSQVQGSPMIWQEFRAHNFIFASRHVVVFVAVWISDYVGGGFWILHCFRVVVVFVVMYIADVITDSYRANSYETTTGSMPYWEGCPAWVEATFKHWYAYAQYIATLAALKSDYGNFFMMFPIQLASFLMTLVRKGILGTRGYHLIYFWSLAQVLVVFSSTYFTRKGYWGTLFVVYIMYRLRTLGISKYVVWSAFVVVLFLAEAGLLYQPSGGVAMTVAAVCLSLLQLFAAGQHRKRAVRYFEQRSKSLVLLRRNPIGESLVHLQFGMPRGYSTGIAPGEHIRLICPNPSKGISEWNGLVNIEAEEQLISRSYTLVSAGSADSVDLIVRLYGQDASKGFPQGGRATTSLAHLTKGQEVLATGPHGHRYYYGAGHFSVDGHVFSTRHVGALVAGSGVSPVLGLLANLWAEGSSCGILSLSLIHVVRDAAEALHESWYTGERPSCRYRWTTKESADGKEQDFPQTIEKQLREMLPTVSEGVVVLTSGPPNFLNSLSLPVLRKLGYQHIIRM